MNIVGRGDNPKDTDKEIVDGRFPSSRAGSANYAIKCLRDCQKHPAHHKSSIESREIRSDFEDRISMEIPLESRPDHNWDVCISGKCAPRQSVMYLIITSEDGWESNLQWAVSKEPRQVFGLPPKTQVHGGLFG